MSVADVQYETGENRVARTWRTQLGHVARDNPFPEHDCQPDDGELIEAAVNAGEAAFRSDIGAARPRIWAKWNKLSDEAQIRYIKQGLPTAAAAVRVTRGARAIRGATTACAQAPMPAKRRTPAAIWCPKPIDAAVAGLSASPVARHEVYESFRMVGLDRTSAMALVGAMVSDGEYSGLHRLYTDLRCAAFTVSAALCVVARQWMSANDAA